MADKQSPKKDQKPSPASKTSKDGSHHGTGAPPAPSAAEDHVSGQPVKQSLFGKMRSMSMSAKDSLTRLAKVIPSKDTSDVKNAEDLEDTGRPKTGTKTSTDDDGPVWEPGTEQLMWTDPTYVVEKFVQPGIHPNHNENFVKPEVWWNSAEDAMKELEMERRGLKQKSLDQQNVLARAMLATNRFITKRLEADQVKKQAKFRGGIDCIAHVLPPDVQRALHAKLCNAAKKGEKEQMAMLLRYDIDLDYSDQFGTPLHYAAYFGQLHAAHVLLERGAYPGSLNYREQTPLHIAVSKNAHPVVDLLVRYGAPTNATEMGGATAIQIASASGFLKTVENLIMGGADCNKLNRIGWSPLHLACMGLHHEVLEKLCVSGMANPNAGCGMTKDVVLGKSGIGKGRQRIFRAVKGDTPAHFAAKEGYFMCLKVLLENGVNTCTTNENGETLMHLAVQTLDRRCVDRILEYGTDYIDMEDKLGRDPIDVCDDMLVENSGTDPESVQKRKVINAIKTVLQRASVQKNQLAHKAMMEQAKRGIGGRKKKKKTDASDGTSEEQGPTIVEKPMDDKTMEEMLVSMKIELESARAQARNSEAQSRMKSYELNEALLETKRRLIEAEFMLERERESRMALEQDVLSLIQNPEEYEEEYAEKDKGNFSRGDSREGPEGYPRALTYDHMRLSSAPYDSTFDSNAPSRTQSPGIKGKYDGRFELEDSRDSRELATVERSRSGVLKDFTRAGSFSSTTRTQEVTFALEEELNEYEYDRPVESYQAGAPPRQPLRPPASLRNRDASEIDVDHSEGHEESMNDEAYTGRPTTSQSRTLPRR